MSVSIGFRDLAAKLRAIGVATPELDARLLVCEACGLSHERFVADPGRPIARHEATRLAAFAERRLRREPVSRILARRAFFEAEFLLGQETLDPRPETETLVEAALELLANPDPRPGRPRLLDLGTGTGCILLSLLMELPRSTGVGTDLSLGALRVARRNAQRLGLRDRARFVCADWSDGLAGVFDMVVANPPYVPTALIPSLAPEVARHDPPAALDGGSDGLDAYRAMLAGLCERVRPGGCIVLEVGQGQAEAVVGLMSAQGLIPDADGWRRHRDLAGILRCVAGRLRRSGGGRKKGVGNCF